ncbi:hypothetical protein HY493_02695 [Candidatus Woesearchaeota archaeon]|nr:hypothetical protein [Candidatus Woesearchaeota archaeon]
MHRKGQITLFIIIGLLIVLTVGSIIYLNAQRARPFVGLPQTEEVAEAVQPLQSYISECVETVSAEGLKLLGDHGGYLSPQSVRNAKLNAVEPTESDLLMFAPDSQYGVAYWWYMSSKNTCSACVFDSKRPALYKSEERQGLPSIEGQLETYVESNLPSCLKDFEGFKEQGFTVVADTDVDAQAFVTATGVVVGLTQEFTATRGDERHVLQQFAVTLPVRVKDMYDLATNITSLESENAFLAKHAKELIAATARTDPNALPPLSTLEFELGPGVTWVKFSVAQRVQQLLTSYVPLLQVFGTNNYRPVETPDNVENPDIIGNVLNRNAVIPQLRPWPGIEARLTYLPTWKPYFDLNCKGQICQPESFMNDVIFIFGFQRYQFAYDLSYPVLVELREPAAFFGDGYTFRFALEGNLRNNEPVTADWRPAEAAPPDETTSMLCNRNQWTSGQVNITVRESINKRPLDAAITYDCGIEECIIGKTAGGLLDTPLPRCAGGVLKAAVTDHVPGTLDLNSNTDDAQRADFELHPIVSVNVSILKYRLKKDLISRNWILDTEPVPFGQHDQAFISIARSEGEEFNAYTNICGNKFTKGTEFNKDVRVTAGNYTVTITSLYHGDIIIPPDKRCYKTGSFPNKKKKCYDIPETAIEFGKPTANPCTSEKPFPSGTIQFPWEITPSMLRDIKGITFKTIVMAAEIPGTPLVVEDLEQITSGQGYVDADPSLVKPVIT